MSRQPLVVLVTTTDNKGFSTKVYGPFTTPARASMFIDTLANQNNAVIEEVVSPDQQQIGDNE